MPVTVGSWARLLPLIQGREMSLETQVVFRTAASPKQTLALPGSRVHDRTPGPRSTQTPGQRSTQTLGGLSWTQAGRGRRRSRLGWRTRAASFPGRPCPLG